MPKRGCLLLVNDSVLLYVNLIETRSSALLQLCKQKSSRNLLLLLVIWASLNYSSSGLMYYTDLWLTYLQSFNWYEQRKRYKWLSHKDYAHSQKLSAHFQKCHVKGSQDPHVSLGENAGTVMNCYEQILVEPMFCCFQMTSNYLEVEKKWTTSPKLITGIDISIKFKEDFHFFSAIGQNIWLYFF